MKTTKDIKAAVASCTAGILLGIAAGWLFFGRTQEPESHNHATGVADEVWTCSMHPQIRQDKPGKCPICAMELIRLVPSGSVSTASADIMLSEEAAALADVQTARVTRGAAIKEIFLYGTIQSDERLARSEVAHAGGRIEKLHVNFTGETILEGQKIATIYSPTLLNAQRELLEAADMYAADKSQAGLIEAARGKLRLMKLTDRQIAEIEASGQTSALTDIMAQAGGIVAARKVAEGDYVNQGSVLFELTGLSSVWAMFDAYEADLPYIRQGDRLTYTLQALPGKKYTGRVAFIDPSLDMTTRTAKVRVETSNPGLLLKPGMYALAKVETETLPSTLTAPKTAVLWTGKRSIVYVRRPNSPTPSFSLREVELGTSLGDMYSIISGLEEGEEVVTSGAFAIDASAQLEGKPSMMNNNTPGVGAIKTSFAVAGLCEMCKERIETAAGSLTGVVAASWDMETKQLSIEYIAAQTSPSDVAQAVALSGHDTDAYKAADSVYDSLPDCCKYRL
ncbi:MAG: efflux RND transporter periplasmic adaptor subunit [Tannerellaceae bacterium]|jgi:Cu(I)/Ag(I) efflux system membrane fusion protein|nr:efflux RND transporter periplasmic adaptor subunit [Tannerellaceae bacterium]